MGDTSVGDKETPRRQAEQEGTEKPLLLVDVDGVISLFGFPLQRPPEGSFHSIEGIPHFISSAAGQHLRALSSVYQLVWASGWEEKANEHLPSLLRLEGPLPHISFKRSACTGASLRAHWKLHAVDAYAEQRPLAWIDDAFNDACDQWAAQRQAPTLLVPTAPESGLTEREALTLRRWAAALSQ